MTISAQIIEDSISERGDRITTFQLKYWRAIHAEVMTHRTFCISGDAKLDFDLPAADDSGERRVYSMSLRNFADKWVNGSLEGTSPRFNNKTLDDIVDDKEYSAEEISKYLDFSSRLNVNAACRDKQVPNAYKAAATNAWMALGSSWKTWRNSMGTRRFSLKSRLSEMRLRQVNEYTGEVLTTTVKNCIISGVKPVFKIVAGKYSTTATKDHRILTDSGWKRLGEIVPGKDKICTYSRGSGEYKDPYKKIDGQWVSSWSLKNRDFVADRQGFKCHLTGDPLEPSFHLHHIEPRHKRPDLAFELDNVVAVNPEAHKKLHEKQGWQKGTPLGTTFELVSAIEPVGEIDTYDLEVSGEFPNFIADGIVVHNSRNASSSRAIPTAKISSQALENIVYPIRWGKNQPGMQASLENLSPEDEAEAKAIWTHMAEVCAKGVEQLSELGLHKQWANRPLEWFSDISVVLTSTEWDNYFELRDHDAAQPEIAALARAQKAAMDASTPKLLKPGEWHLPYILPEERDQDPLLLAKLSSARCARVSYLKHDNEAPSEDEDLKLFKRLVGSAPIHASPTEHQATPVSLNVNNPIYGYSTKNLRGWVPFRSFVELGEVGEND